MQAAAVLERRRDSKDAVRVEHHLCRARRVRAIVFAVEHTEEAGIWLHKQTLADHRIPRSAQRVRGTLLGFIRWYRGRCRRSHRGEMRRICRPRHRLIRAHGTQRRGCLGGEVGLARSGIGTLVRLLLPRAERCRRGRASSAAGGGVRKRDAAGRGVCRRHCLWTFKMTYRLWLW